MSSYAKTHRFRSLPPLGGLALAALLAPFLGACESIFPVSGQADNPPWLSADRWLNLLQVEMLVASVGLILATAALLALIPDLRRAWEGASGLQRRATVALVLGGLFLRLFVPSQFVTAYSGYALINQALGFSGPMHGGSAGPLLYHLLMHVVPGGWDAYFAINTVLGALTLPLAAWWATRYLNRRHLFFPLLALLAVLPLLVKDHNSESSLIPAIFALFVGLLHWESFRKTASLSALVLAVSALAFATLCHPLAMGFVLPGLLILEAGRGFTGLHAQARPILGAFLVALALLVPNLLVRLAHYQTGLSLAEPGVASRLWDSALVQWLVANPFFSPAHTPLALILLMLLAFLTSEKGSRRPLIALFAMGSVFVALSFVGSPALPLTHLQTGGVYFFVILAAVGLTQLDSPQVPHPMFQRPKVWVFLLAVSSLWPVETLWTPDTDQEEIRALNTITGHLPDASVTLARLEAGDLPASRRISRDYPDHLFRPPRRDDRLISLAELASLEEKGELSTTFVYLGTRCYALEGERPVLDGVYEHPACAQLRQRPDLEVVWEEAVPNHRRRPDFIWYPESKTLTLGLYRIAAPNGRAAHGP